MFRVDFAAATPRRETSMSLIRCTRCRYSFERGSDEPATSCPQCGEQLGDGDETESREVSERQPTQELRTIPKPND
jgi:predicted  nucleic acid-binding Zn-ribbon protein